MIDFYVRGAGYRAGFSRRGGTCFSLVHEQTGADILRSPPSERALEESPFLYGNPILFPPNRIRGGAFTFEGREYRFPVNEENTGCHLHGICIAPNLRRTKSCADSLLRRRKESISVSRTRLRSRGSIRWMKAD